MALVDPFIPQPQVLRMPAKQAPVSSKLPNQPSVQVGPASIASVQLPGRHKKTFEAPLRPAGRTKLLLQGIVITLLAMVLGLAASAQSVGEMAIAIYAIVALVTRFPSGTSFVLALLALMMIALLETLRPMSNLAANFAIYAFLLLVVGTLSLSLEMRQAVAWKRWRRQSKGRNRG
jgi:hypothetical protein